MESAVPVSPQCTAMKESFLFLMPSAQNWYLEQVRLTSGLPTYRKFIRLSWMYHAVLKQRLLLLMILPAFQVQNTSDMTTITPMLPKPKQLQNGLSCVPSKVLKQEKAFRSLFQNTKWKQKSDFLLNTSVKNTAVSNRLPTPSAPARFSE